MFSHHTTWPWAVYANVSHESWNSSPTAICHKICWLCEIVIKMSFKSLLSTVVIKIAQLLFTKIHTDKILLCILPFFASTSWLHSVLYCLSITNNINKKTKACMLYSMYTTLAGSRSILHPHFSKFMIVMAYRDLILRPQPLMMS